MNPPTPSVHRLGSGLPGYLILFAPPTFAPQRQYRSSGPPSPPVFCRISTHFTATPCIPATSSETAALESGRGGRNAGYQRISPLHPAFRPPLPDSSAAVSDALSGLSPELSHPTRSAAYAPFTPSKSEQRSGPLYYRGCWHRVSRPFLLGYTQLRDVLGPLACSPMTGVYNPKAFILHAASHCQAFAHCK